MEVDEAVLKFNEYRKFVNAYLDDCLSSGESLFTGCNARSTLHRACLDVLIALDGDESLFKQCFEKTKKQFPCNWATHNFDENNAHLAAHYITALASLVTK
ncbi:MAG: hypothetical protein KJ955_01160 [Nanoarchaeota archaeon]|nr:hypothetical protein [Nanoarchaeota archaeon]